MAWSLSSILSFLQTFAVDLSITQPNLIDFIRLRYERVFNEALKFYKTEETFATVNGIRYYYIPRIFSLSNGVRFYNQSQPGRGITVVDWEQILEWDQDQDQTGTPTHAALVGISPVLIQPKDTSLTTTASFVVRSSSLADTTQTIELSGTRIDGSNRFTDVQTVTLNGTTNVTIPGSWNQVTEFSKSGNTTGYILLRNTADTSTYAIIDPYEAAPQYQKWRLWPTPTAADTLNIVGYRIPIIPQNAAGRLDVPLDLEGSFIHGLRADIHDINFDMIKAQKYEGMFEAGLQKFKERMLLGTGEVFTEGVQDSDAYDPLNQLPGVNQGLNPET